jgi:TRAP-type C4-dicarboxylate transport system permease small subunit
MRALDTDPSSTLPPWPVRRVLDASDALLAVERLVLSGLMTLLVVLVLLNVVTRYAGMPLYWVDEASVYAVVWLTFVGASVMTRLRLDFAVTMLTDKLGPRLARTAKLIASSGVLVFALALVAMCWLWMDPVGIARAGFDAKEYAAESFNFLYTERTQTLEWPVWVLQLIMPIFAVCMSLHALANLLEDLRLAPPRPHPGFQAASADAVN